MMSGPNTLQAILQKAQFNALHHSKLVRNLSDICDKANIDTFLQDFVNYLKFPLTHGNVSSSLRVLDFVAKFCAHISNSSKSESTDEEEDDDDDCPLITGVFKALFDFHCSKLQTVRMRVCYTIKKILENLGEEASISQTLSDKIFSNMLERMKDKSPAVRAQAVSALQRLQDPTDPDCSVTKTYLYHMSRDPSADVRRAVLQCLGRSKSTLPHIRQRIHDVKDTVRKQAYISLSKLSIRSHSIKDREMILDQGLKDRSDAVRDTVEKMLLSSWLKCCNGNIMEFLHALDVENSPEVPALALNAVFKTTPVQELVGALELGSDKLVPSDKLTVELTYYWCCLGKYLHSQEGDQWEMVVPELTPFCEYIKKNLTKLKAEDIKPWNHTQGDFVVLQLLELTKVFDLSDETGRENLKQLLLNMLLSPDVRIKLIPSIVGILVEVIPDVTVRLQALAEVISEIHQPMTEVQLNAQDNSESEFKRAQLRVEKNILEEDLEIAVREKTYLRAEELKNKLTKVTEELAALSVEHVLTNKTQESQLPENPPVLSKCLSIVYEMMQSPTVTTLTPQLRSLMQNFVSQSLKIEHAVVQVMALQCMAVFGLLDEEKAQEHMVVFCFYLGSSCEEIAIVALKAIFDTLLMHGLKTFAIEDVAEDKPKRKSKKQKKNLLNTIMEDSNTIGSEDDETSDHDNHDHEDQEDHQEEESSHTNNLLPLLTSLLDSSCGATLTTAAEGLCKLLLAGQVTSPTLLSRLIILWFNPIHEDDVYLQQSLGQFFKMYATICPQSQEVLEQTFIPTLATIKNAPYASPLTQIEVENVAKFLLDLTKPHVNKFSTQVNHNVHYNLALEICNELLKEKDRSSEWVQILCHTDLLLDEDQKNTLQNMVNKLAKDCPDKAYSRAIDKFQRLLDISVQKDKTVVTFRNTEEPVGDLTVNHVSLPVNATPFQARRVIAASDENSDADSVKSQIKNRGRKPSGRDITILDESVNISRINSSQGDIVVPETSDSDS